MRRASPTATARASTATAGATDGDTGAARGDGGAARGGVAAEAAAALDVAPDTGPATPSDALSLFCYLCFRLCSPASVPPPFPALPLFGPSHALRPLPGLHIPIPKGAQAWVTGGGAFSLSPLELQTQNATTPNGKTQKGTSQTQNSTWRPFNAF